MKSLLVICVLFVACGRQAPRSTETSSAPRSGLPAAATQSADSTISDETPQLPPADRPASATPAPSGTIVEIADAPAKAKNITIESVTLGNPLIVTGTARTFENSVSLRVRDANGQLISENFTTATGEMGQFSPYRGSLWLTRHPGKRVIVEALEYSARDGSEQSVVRVERPFAIESVNARLFFPDATCSGVKPFARAIPKSVSMARLLVEALIAGPAATEKRAGAAAPFPEGSRVQSVNLRDGTLTVDFNERLRNVGGSCQAQMIRAAVTETLRQLPTVKKVVITAGGSEPLALQP
ncbi:MAG TPA: GerMN domain-containing protein [Thermoanaerobaculia bacterium]